jgi:hypothetical protein
MQGRIQDFKLGGGRGGTLAKMFGVFCVKNHDFRPKNLIFFSNFRVGGLHRPWVCIYSYSLGRQNFLFIFKMFT